MYVYVYVSVCVRGSLFLYIEVHVHVVIDLHDFYFQTEGGDNLCFPIPYSPKIFKVENFRGSKYSHNNFLPQNFKFITAAMCGWKLDHENFICQNWFSFEQNLAKL